MTVVEQDLRHVALLLDSIQCSHEDYTITALDLIGSIMGNN